VEIGHLTSCLLFPSRLWTAKNLSAGCDSSSRLHLLTLLRNDRGSQNFDHLREGFQKHFKDSGCLGRIDFSQPCCVLRFR